MRTPVFNRFAPLALATLLAGCADTLGSNLGGGLDGQFDLQVATQPATSNDGNSNATADTVEAQGDVLVLSRVQMVVRDLELDPADDSCPDSTAAEPGDDSCEVERGPFILDLPLGDGAAKQFTAEVAAGAYEEIEFTIHKPEDDEGDDAFLQAHPEWQGRSIVVAGTFNGEPFTYSTDVNVDQEIELVSPLVVTASSTADLTLFVDVSGWFVNLTTGALINPALAIDSGSLESVVEGNIVASFEAFEDGDQDGQADDS